MHTVLSQRAHLPTAVPGLRKAPVQNLILHISQQNPKASSIHYPESNPRVLFINVRNSTFKGAGMWHSCWQLCHYPNYTKLPQLQRAMTYNSTTGNSARVRQATSCNGSSGPEHFCFERHIPTIFLLCNSSPSERKPLFSLVSSNPSIHNPPMYTQMPWRFAVQTDWVGQGQWQDKVSRGSTANSQTGGGCWLL